MPREVTVQAIIDAARRRADDFEDEALANDDELLTYVDQAYGKHYDLLVTAEPAYFQTVQTVNTVAGTKTVALPADWYATVHVDILEGGATYDNLDRLQIHERLCYQEQGRPCRYQLEGAALALYPTPSSVYTIRHTFIPVWAPLTLTTLAGDPLVVVNRTIDGLLGNEDLIELEVALRLKEKEEKEGQTMTILLQKRDEALERLTAKAFQRSIVDAQVAGGRNLSRYRAEGDWPRRGRGF